MDTIDKLKNKLPDFIEDNTVLQSFLGAIAGSIDTFVETLSSLTTATSPGQASGSALDSIGGDMLIRRNYDDSDEVLRILIQNSIKTHQERGSEVGLLQEGSHLCGITPYIQTIQYVIGIDPIGVGEAVGGVGAKWIQIWNSTNISRNNLLTQLDKILPIHNQIGINYIVEQYAVAEKSELAGEVVTIEGMTDEDGNPLGVDYPENSGFEYVGECLKPKQPQADFHQIGILDLGSDYDSYNWIVDWIDYARWDTDHEVKMYVRFSDDQNVWTQYGRYIKNQFVNGENIARYAQFRFELTLTSYEDFSHYLFRKFIMKGMDTTQLQYGEYDRGFDLQKEILN